MAIIIPVKIRNASMVYLAVCPGQNFASRAPKHSAYIVIGSIALSESLGPNNVSDSIAELVGNAESKFLR